MVKQLVVWDDTKHTLEAVHPNAASAAPLPAFRIGALRPTVGSINGQAFIDARTGIASVWNGNKWDEIAKPEIIQYDHDTDLLQSTPNDGNVAVSLESGNVFTRTNGQWLSLGLRIFDTAASVPQADEPVGTLAFAKDTGDFYVRAPSNTGDIWVVLSNQGVHVGTAGSSNAITGDLWLNSTTKELKIFDGTNWSTINWPIEIASSNPANPVAGQLLYRTNRNGTLNVYDGTNWIMVGHAIHRGTAANRPDWNSSDYGDIYEATDTKELFYAGEGGWWPISQPINTKIANAAPDTDWEQQTIHLPANKVSKLAGNWSATDDNSHFIIAFAKQGGGKITNYFLNRTVMVNYNTGRHLASSSNTGGGAGGGWWGCSHNPIRRGRWGTFEILCVYLGTFWTVEVECFFPNNVDETCHSRALFSWDNSSHPLAYIYLSSIRGQHPSYQLKKVF